MSKIVTATIGPIKAKDIRLPTVAVNDSDRNKVDPNHPITKAMMYRLPLLSDDDLKTLRTFITKRDVNSTGQSLQDIESWLYMIDEEIIYRAKERSDALKFLINKLTP